MNSRRIYVNLAVFAAAFFVMVAWLAQNVVSFNAIDNPYKISAEFENAFGILPNAEVTYLGVQYGRVSDVDLVTGGVRVEMEIKRGKKIPEGSTAGISRKSAIGEQYVDFVPPAGGGSGASYESGAHLTRDQTTVPLEFSEFLRSASNLVASVPPESLRVLLHEAAVGLNGRTDSLRALAEAGATFSDTLAARTEALDRLAVNNTRLTRTLAEHRGSFGQSLTNLRQVAGSLRNAQGDTSALLDQGSQFLGQTADIVAARKNDLSCSLKVLELLVDETTTNARLAGLRALLAIGPRAFAGVWDSRDVEADGPWLRVGFIANPVLNKPDQYVPPRELPAVAAPAACPALLANTGVDYRPAPDGSSLPATGAPWAVAGGLVLLAATVVIRGAGRVGE